jgi:hypothetical protein
MNSLKFLPALVGFLMAIPAFGTVVGAGTFNLSGTAVGSTTGIDFYLTTPGDQTGSINLPTSGVFASLAPTTQETIQDLTVANGVTPGTPFDFKNWIQLTDNINLDATSIPIPVFPTCSASGSESVGYECLVNAASPVVLTQGITGVGARIDVFGDAHYAGDPNLTPFTGLFTSPTTSFSTIAAFETYFDTNHEIPAISYSASFTTTASPEPAALILTSVGLLGFGLMRKRRKSI